MPDVVMPRLSDSMEEGTILKWLKADGDEVARGDELVEIETDKATMTYEADTRRRRCRSSPRRARRCRSARSSRASAPAARRRRRQRAGRGDQQAEASGNGAPSEAPPAPTPAATRRAARGRAPAARPAAPARRRRPSPRATAAARRPRRSRGGSRASRASTSPRLQGTGPGGRIVKADVEAAAAGSAARRPPRAAGRPAAPAAEPQAPAAAAPAPTPASVAESGTAKGDVSVQELTRTQQVIARRMAESKATVPDFTIATDVDMEGAVALRGQLKAAAGRGRRRAVLQRHGRQGVRAGAARVPARQRRLQGRALRALLAGQRRRRRRRRTTRSSCPTVFDADRKALGEIARESRALAERVRANAVTPPELSRRHVHRLQPRHVRDHRASAP